MSYKNSCIKIRRHLICFLIFIICFVQVQVAHYSLDSAAWQSHSTNKRWKGVEQTGAWTQETAGGSPNYRYHIHCTSVWSVRK